MGADSGDPYSGRVYPVGERQQQTGHGRYRANRRALPGVVCLIGLLIFKIILHWGQTSCEKFDLDSPLVTTRPFQKSRGLLLWQGHVPSIIEVAPLAFEFIAAEQTITR